jgi:hypothetical protein
MHLYFCILLVAKWFRPYTTQINLRILYLIPITLRFEFDIANAITLGFDIANDTVVIMQDTCMLLI